MSEHLRFLLSPVYSGALHPAHRADLYASGLLRATIQTQKIRSVPIHMIDKLLGYASTTIQHGYVIPFADPRGGWRSHVRMKVWGGDAKYLQPRGSGVRVYFPLAALEAVLHTDEELYVVEGEKKALAVAQEGYAAVGICGIAGWRKPQTRALHPDLDDVGLQGRRVKVIPDADATTNAFVRREVNLLSAALIARGASVEVVRMPAGVKGVDDFLVTQQ